MKLAPMLFVRPGELRRSEWSEIDLDKAEWRIPAAKMKGRIMHIVPLAKQAVRILMELRPLTDRSPWVFPGVRTNGEPMSENTVNAALRRLGYDRSTLTAHGFRGMGLDDAPRARLAGILPLGSAITRPPVLDRSQ
jgi:integrase